MFAFFLQSHHPRIFLRSSIDRLMYPDIRKAALHNRYSPRSHLFFFIRRDIIFLDRVRWAATSKGAISAEDEGSTLDADSRIFPTPPCFVL